MTTIKVRIEAGNTFAVVKSGHSIPSRRLSPSEPLGTRNILATLAAVERLRAATAAGTVRKPLRGKNIALLIGSSPEGARSALSRAASELGAQVAEVSFTEPAGSASSNADIRALARMLGRMYDAIDCGAMTTATAQQMEKEAGVPVYQGLDMDDHPVRILADLMALREQRPPTATQASILFLGDPRTLRGQAFLSAAREMGFDVQLEVQCQLASNDATFVVDATNPAHWSLRTPSGALDEARRSEIHRLVMQAVLLDTVVND